MKEQETIFISWEVLYNLLGTAAIEYKRQFRKAPNPLILIAELEEEGALDITPEMWERVREAKSTLEERVTTEFPLNHNLNQVPDWFVLQVQRRMSSENNSGMRIGKRLVRTEEELVTWPAELQRYRRVLNKRGMFVLAKWNVRYVALSTVQKLIKVENVRDGDYSRSQINYWHSIKDKKELALGPKMTKTDLKKIEKNAHAIKDGIRFLSESEVINVLLYLLREGKLIQDFKKIRAELDLIIEKRKQYTEVQKAKRHATREKEEMQF